MSPTWSSGNAAEDSRDNRGWLVGHFIDPSQGVRSTRDVEVKWGIHPAGEKRPQWADDTATTLVILINGHFRVELAETSVTLTQQGDYLMWQPGTKHTWEALDDSVVLTVRWPSGT